MRLPLINKLNLNSVTIKIVMILVFTSLITVIVSVIGITKIREMHEVTNSIYKDNTTVLFPITDAQQAMYSCQTYAIQMIQNSNSNAISEFYSELNNVQGYLEELESYIPDESLTEYQTNYNNYKTAAMNLYNSLITYDSNTSVYYRRFNEQTKIFLDYLYGINKRLRIVGTETYERGSQIFNSVIRLQSVITIIGVLLSIVLALFISMIVIIKPLQDLRDTTERLATGDLLSKVTITSADEIGAVGFAYNKAIDELRTLLIGTSQHAQNINSSSDDLFKIVDESLRSLGELNNLVTELANSANEQTNIVNSAVTKIRNSGEEISNVLNVLTTIDDTCREVAVEAERGGLANETSINYISTFVNNVDEIQTTVEDLAQDLQQIQEVVDVIWDISEQTSLLSLNALIEASRAGEQGRGFGVVAGNIRSLAYQSKESAENIKNLVFRIFDKTTQTVNSVAKSTSEIKNTQYTLTETMGIFDRLIERVNQITTELKSISTIAKGVHNFTLVIVSEMNKLVVTSEDNLAATEEVAATFQQQYASMETLNNAAHNLRQLAKKLEESSKKFILY